MINIMNMVMSLIQNNPVCQEIPMNVQYVYFHWHIKLIIFYNLVDINFIKDVLKNGGMKLRRVNLLRLQFLLASS